MIVSKKTLLTLVIAALAVSTIHGQVDSNFYCFLLFGQSNMTGGGATSPSSSSSIRRSARRTAFGSAPERRSASAVSSAQRWDPRRLAAVPLHLAACRCTLLRSTLLDTASTILNLGIL